MNLDLDESCPLCDHVIPCLRNVNVNQLYKKMARKKVYETLYGVYLKEREAMGRRNNYINITLEQLTNHFENHEIDLTSCIYSDLNSTRTLQRVVYDKIFHSESIDARSVKLWRDLSMHKVILFAKLQNDTSDYEAMVPYSFS